MLSAVPPHVGGRTLKKQTHSQDLGLGHCDIKLHYHTHELINNEEHFNKLMMNQYQKSGDSQQFLLFNSLTF